ncbi:MAG: uroporphyrinogen decarboxylase family protein, partial [Chloroflexota bacterium]|nr:uroporphyrinogen decarboxylase family protein [Chloroflexota bacterium]
VGEFATDGRVMADAQIALQRELGQDVIFVGVDNYYIAAGFGCKIDIPDDEIPHLAEPAVDRLEDVYSLKVPDPLTDGRMPVMLEATRRVREVLGDEICIRTPGTGPFALASYFIGTQNFLVEVGLAEADLPDANPDAIHHALDLAAEALIAFGIACWDAGADLLHCGDSLASCDMISPRQYIKWAFPYQKKVIQAWKAYGARTLLHICGNATKVLEWYADTGADVVEIDHKVDLAYAKQAIGDRTCLLGNVDTVAPLLLDTPDEVRAASEKCIQDAASGGGYMLGSGCMVPRTTPIENVKAMVDVARTHRNDRWN